MEVDQAVAPAVDRTWLCSGLAMPPDWIRTSDLRSTNCSFAGILCLVEPGLVGLGGG